MDRERFESNKAGRNLLRVGAIALLGIGLVNATDSLSDNDVIAASALAGGTAALAGTAASGYREKREIEDMATNQASREQD